jgi:hypothetical protein
MKRRSPTAEGFKTIFHRPSIAFAEISWRWTVGFAAAVLITFSFVEYLDTLPVTPRDLFLLSTRQSLLIAQAVAHILRGSGPRVAYAMIFLGLALAVAWIVIASLGRAATVQALLSYLRRNAENDVTPKVGNDRLRSLLAIHFLRAATTLAALVSCVAAGLLGGAASPKTDPSPGSAFLIFLTVVMLVSAVWSLLNWFLSLAAVFVVTNDQDAVGAMSAAVDLIRKRPGAVFAPSSWFGLAHGVAFVIASSAVAFPLAFAEVLPPAVILGGVLLVLLLYFAAADFFYVGRLAAYVVAILDQDLPPDAIQPLTQVQPPRQPSRWQPSDDDILSDVPAPA